jgi:hypothetical protein
MTFTTLEQIERCRKENGLRELTQEEVAILLLKREYKESDYGEKAPAGHTRLVAGGKRMTLPRFAFDVEGHTVVVGEEDDLEFAINKDAYECDKESEHR